MKTALITPSYAPDSERCRALCTSVDRWLDPAIDHLVVVPRRDLASFSGLPVRSQILTVESVLPRKVLQASEKWWLTPCSLPVRGWIMQQLVKLSVVVHLDYDVFVYVDSDVLIINAVTPDLFVKDNLVRFYQVPCATMPSKRHRHWHQNSAKMLQVRSEEHWDYDYIGPFVTWRKDRVLDMLQQIQRTNGRHWFTCLCNTLDFSECILYGVYVSSLPHDHSGHFDDEVCLCHCTWSYSVESASEIESFLEGLMEHHLGIHIQSNLGIDVQEYLGLLKDRGLMH